MHRSKLINNSLSGGLQLILTSILALISVPIFISRLGVELYGIFAIISVIGNLNKFANLGLNGSLLVYISKQGKSKESNYDIFVTITFMTTLLIIISIVSIIFSDFIISKVFSIPQIHHFESRTLLIYLIISNSILLIGQSFTSRIDSQQKIVITNACQFVYSMIYWTSIIIILVNNGGISKIGVGVLVSAVIWFLLVLYYAKSIWGNFNITGIQKYYFSALKKQVSYGSKIYLGGVMSFLFEPLSKILISNFIGLHAVSYFDIGIRVRTQIYGLISKLLYPLFPFIASNQDSAFLKHKLHRFSNLIQFLIVPVSTTLIFILPILTKYWIGETDLRNITIFITSITVSMLLLSPSMIPIYHYLLAKNKASKTVYIQLSSVVVNISSFLLIYHYFGIFTIIISNILGYIASFIMCYYYQFKFLKIDLKTDIIFHIKIGIFGLSNLLFCGIIFANKEITIIDIIIYPMICYLLFVIYIRFTKILTLKDTNYYFGSISKLELFINKALFIR